MEVLRHIEHGGQSVPNPVLTLGNLDGVHLGHQALLRHAVEDARARSGKSVVVTFEPHPLKILAPDRAPQLLLTHKDKLLLLQSLGVDIVIIQTFDQSFADVEADEFVRRYLVERLKIRKLWVGNDLRFGKNRKGRVEDLIRWGSEAGFEVGVVSAIELNGVRVSSSRIRTMLEQGRVDEARRFLGRYHCVSGRVVMGRHRGRGLGFPTANVLPRTEVIPGDGIYATFLQAGARKWSSVTSIGLNPTFGQGPRTIETFIFDFEGDLYGQAVRLFFVQWLREERKFASPDKLVEQIDQDVSRAKEILLQVGPDEALLPVN
jgi:riboflavin kinase / FMN adenylyltransferase